jgi:hypothetical protein
MLSSKCPLEGGKLPSRREVWVLAHIANDLAAVHRCEKIDNGEGLSSHKPREGQGRHTPGEGAAENHGNYR